MSGTRYKAPPSVRTPLEKDPEIEAALIEAGFDPNLCMQCGTCTASCLSGRWTAMRTREIMRKAAFGDESVLSDPDIWLCTTCYACYDRCPRDLKVTDAIIVLRNIASKRGFIADKHRKTVDILHKTGHAVPINDKIKAIRKELGLPEIPPTAFAYPEEVRKMAQMLFILPPKHEDEEDTA
ncbi:MAG: CoB--CoM heterodisulfide reductase subunit C [Candidatus Thorarchaeota archaeon]